MIFRRPELEKDNPIAPQPYIGPRRRLAMARAAASGELSEVGDMRDTLQTLTKAASRFVNSLQKARKADTGLKALRDAIAQAEQVLSVKTAP
jgi:Tfp pilus assembly protein PilN